MRRISYDVSIRLPVGGLDGKYVEVSHLGNITWNVRELIKWSSGWNIKNEDSNGDVLPWIKMIEHGISELENHPDKYKKYEASNGWGTVSGTLNFYHRCFDEASDWISFNEDLLPAAVIWVS